MIAVGLAVLLAFTLLAACVTPSGSLGGYSKEDFKNAGLDTNMPRINGTAVRLSDENLKTLRAQDAVIVIKWTGSDVDSYTALNNWLTDNDYGDSDDDSDDGLLVCSYRKINEPDDFEASVLYAERKTEIGDKGDLMEILRGDLILIIYDSPR